MGILQLRSCGAQCETSSLPWTSVLAVDERALGAAPCWLVSTAWRPCSSVQKGQRRRLSHNMGSHPQMKTWFSLTPPLSCLLSACSAGAGRSGLPLRVTLGACFTCIDDQEQRKCGINSGDKGKAGFLPGWPQS